MTEAKPEPTAPEAEPPTPEPAATPSSPVEAKAPAREKRAPSIWVRALRVLLGLMILIGIGALLVLFLLYIPLRQDYSSAQRRMNDLTYQATSDLESANQKLDQLSALQAQCKSLQSQLDQSTLHLTILEVKTDVLSAQLALAEEDANKARLALNKTPDRLKTLENLLPQDQRKIISDLQSRLKLVLEELDENPYAAQSDLDVMAATLTQLEAALLP